MSKLQHQYEATLFVEDLGRVGVFDTFSGGETDSDDQKHHAGGMGDEEALGGLATTNNVTVTRLVKAVDIGLLHRARRKVGKRNARVVVKALDADGHAFGSPQVYTGVLKRVTPPEHDSNSSDKAMWEAEVSTDEVVG